MPVREYRRSIWCTLTLALSLGGLGIQNVRGGQTGTQTPRSDPPRTPHTHRVPQTHPGLGPWPTLRNALLLATTGACYSWSLLLLEHWPQLEPATSWPQLEPVTAGALLATAGAGACYSWSLLLLATAGACYSWSLLLATFSRVGSYWPHSVE